jgi:hypothetical protein
VGRDVVTESWPEGVGIVIRFTMLGDGCSVDIVKGSFGSLNE